MPDGDHQDFRRNLLLFVHRDLTELPAGCGLLTVQAGETAVKPDFPAQLPDLLPQVFDHPGKDVRADMGLLLIKDLFRRTEADKGFQHQTVPPSGIFYQSIQLSIGKGSRAALSELDIGFRIQRPAFPERLHVPDPLLHRSPPLQQQRLIPFPCQKPGTEQTCRAGTSHHRPVGKLSDPVSRRPVKDLLQLFNLSRLLLLLACPPQNSLFLPDLHIYCIGIVNVRFFSGINGLFEDLIFQRFCFFQIEKPSDLVLQLLFTVSRLKPYLTKP